MPANPGLALQSRNNRSLSRERFTLPTDKKTGDTLAK